MSALPELFTSVKAKFTADTGTGGLNNSASTARVYFFYDDEDGDTGSNPQAPYIVFKAVDDNADGYTMGVSRLSFQLQVYFNRDRERVGGNAAAVLARLRTVYHRQTLTAGSTWTFAPPTIRNIVSSPSESKYGRYVVSMHTTATKNSGV